MPCNLRKELVKYACERFGNGEAKTSDEVSKGFLQISMVNDEEI